MEKNTPFDISILGQHHQAEMPYLKSIAKAIQAKSTYCTKFTFISEFETQFLDKFDSLLKINKDFIDYKGQSPIIYFNDNKIIGNFEDFIKFIIVNFSYIEETALESYQSIANEDVKKILTSGMNYYAFLEINMSENNNSLIVFELFYHICPKTVMNFLELCKGSLKNKRSEKLTYEKCELFRVVKNGFIQSGDLSHLSGHRCIHGENFEDENFTVKHDTAGILGMVKNKGTPHTNQSQFYITLNPLTSFDGKFVAFGRVIKGLDLLRKVSEVECYLQRPKNRIEIVKSGEYIG